GANANNVSCGSAANCTGAGAMDGFNCQLGAGPAVSALPNCAVGLYDGGTCQAFKGYQCGSGSCVQSLANATAWGCAVSDAGDNSSCLSGLTVASNVSCLPKGGCDTSTDGGACSTIGVGCYCTKDTDCVGAGAKCVSVNGQNDLSCAAGS